MARVYLSRERDARSNVVEICKGDDPATFSHTLAEAFELSRVIFDTALVGSTQAEGVEAVQALR